MASNLGAVVYVPTLLAMEGSSGAFSATIQSNGGFSGKLVQGLSTLLLNAPGQFDLNGIATNTVNINGVICDITLQLTLDRSGQISGVVNSVSGIQPPWFTGFSSPLKAIRNPYSAVNKSPLAGTYTMAIPGAIHASSLPVGYSVAAVSVNSLGTVNMQGYAADGSPINCGTVLSKDGRWPLYAPMPGGGSILGWETISTNFVAIEGWTTWAGTMTPNLFASSFIYQSTNVWGSRYTNQTPLLGFTNGILTFIDGNLAGVLTNRVNLSKSVVTDSTTTNDLKMKLFTTTGLFSGSITNGRTRKVLSFHGVILQNENVGAGAFRVTNQAAGELFLEAK